MDPPSTIRRDLTQEQILEDIIHNAFGSESPSTYLNPSGEGEEVDRNEGEADGSDDGTLTKSGEVYI